MMTFKILKLHFLRGSIARRVLIRVLLFALAMAIIPLLQPFGEYELADGSESSAFRVASDTILLKMGELLKPAPSRMFPIFYPCMRFPCKENEIFATDLFRELMAEKMLKSGSKVLCVGGGSALSLAALRELGFPDSLEAHPEHFMHKLDFEDNSFDFVFSTDIDTVSVPALLVLEIERVLRPHGIGAMLVAVSSSYHGNLIKAAAPISTFLKNSNVVHARNVYSSSLVLFRKKLENVVGPFDHYQLPNECPSVANNMPFMKHLEPLLDQRSVRYNKPRISYLPKFMNVSSRRRFIYIDVGARNLKNSKASNNWLLSSYPKQSRPFDVHIVHHDTSFLSAYVKRPGITFVYHPGLAGNRTSGNSNHLDDLGPLVDDKEFDFIAWFRKTVADDFVVLKMNAVGEELKLLHQMFESGAICLVDELFLRCSTDDKGDGHKDCVELLKGVRNSGVFAHQWLDE